MKPANEARLVKLTKAEGAALDVAWRIRAVRKLVAGSACLRPALDPAVAAACEGLTDAKWRLVAALGALSDVGGHAEAALIFAASKALESPGHGYVLAAEAVCDLEVA